METLFDTINHRNFSEFHEMNRKTVIIFAYQCDKYDYINQVIYGYCLQMISANTKILYSSRNTALSLTKGDICSIADDDVRICIANKSIFRKQQRKEGVFCQADTPYMMAHYVIEIFKADEFATTTAIKNDNI